MLLLKTKISKTDNTSPPSFSCYGLWFSCSDFLDLITQFLAVSWDQIYGDWLGTGFDFRFDEITFWLVDVGRLIFHLHSRVSKLTAWHNGGRRPHQRCTCFPMKGRWRRCNKKWIQSLLYHSSYVSISSHKGIKIHLHLQNIGFCGTWTQLSLQQTIAILMADCKQIMGVFFNNIYVYNNI